MAKGSKKKKDQSQQEIGKIENEDENETGDSEIQKGMDYTSPILSQHSKSTESQGREKQTTTEEDALHRLAKLEDGTLGGAQLSNNAFASFLQTFLLVSHLAISNNRL